MTYSKFIKSETSRTGYRKVAGDFPGELVYLIIPYFVKKRTPVFSLVFKGRHLSGFFKSCLAGAYLGDYKGSGLILFKSDEYIELFEVPQSKGALMESFCSGALNPVLAALRSKFL